MPPLIVTALLDEVAQERFDRLRREHFPPERNQLDAHLTLFHRLPDDPEVDRALAVEARRPALTAQVRRVRGWRLSDRHSPARREFVVFSDSC